MVCWPLASCRCVSWPARWSRVMTWAVMSFVCACRRLPARCRATTQDNTCCCSVMVTVAQIAQLRRSGLVRVKLPFGDTHLAELPDGPLVLIAAGTGMSQMHSLIEHCRATGFAHPVHLYWGARRPDDFYELEQWAQWQQVPNLFLHQVVSDQCGWQGRCGLLHEAVREDFPSLRALHVYASGSPAMVYATLDALVEAGMDAHQMRADVFAYAPRG